MGLSSYKVNDHEFELTKDLTEPCPCCGIPACGREAFLWYYSEARRISIMFDGGDLDYLIETLEGYKFDDKSPLFLSQLNTHEGWRECAEIEGSEIEITDFIESLNILKQQSNAPKVITVAALLEFAGNAAENEKQLRITIT